jgi:hypothetical protein
MKHPRRGAPADASATAAGTATIAGLDTGVDAHGALPLVAGFPAIGGGTGDPQKARHVDASIAATDNGTGNDSDIFTGLDSGGVQGRP